MDNQRVERQLALEELGRGVGIISYRKDQERQDETALKPGRELLRRAITKVSKAIAGERKATPKAGIGRPSIYLRYFSEFEPDVLAYIACRTCINMVADQRTRDAPSRTRVSMRIAELLHEHKLFTELRKAHPNLYNYVEREIDNTSAKRQRWAMRKATKLAERTVVGLEWGEGDKLHVGLRLLELVISETGLVETRLIRRRRSKRVSVYPSEEMIEWLERQHRMLEGTKNMSMESIDALIEERR